MTKLGPLYFFPNLMFFSPIFTSLGKLGYLIIKYSYCSSLMSNICGRSDSAARGHLHTSDTLDPSTAHSYSARSTMFANVANGNPYYRTVL